jgi:hypothetical protein
MRYPNTHGNPHKSRFYLYRHPNFTPIVLSVKTIHNALLPTTKYFTMHLSVRVKDKKLHLWRNSHCKIHCGQAATDLMYSLVNSARMPDIGLKPYISCESVQTSFHIRTQHLWRSHATPRDLRSWNRVFIQPKNQFNTVDNTSHLIILYNTLVFSLLTSDYLTV